MDKKFNFPSTYLQESSPLTDARKVMAVLQSPKSTALPKVCIIVTIVLAALFAIAGAILLI
jgi:hypothetical protein